MCYEWRKKEIGIAAASDDEGVAVYDYKEILIC